eukprot:m.71865 g.71865  ORF g.71865 m.71865 type:complete len:79 (-) comp12282_c0_seq1:279-515(-)
MGVCPDAVHSLNEDSLREVGLSYRKASYVLDLAAHFVDGRLSTPQIMNMNDTELLQSLTAVHGIGKLLAKIQQDLILL